MESGHDIYYEGNTVDLNPEYHHIWQLYQAIDDDEISIDTNVTPVEHKLFATSKCEWCSFPFSGRWLVICPKCQNCQYCGNHSDTGHYCRACGNVQEDQEDM